VSGLALLLFGLLVGTSVGVVQLFRPELLSWNVVTLGLVTLFTLGPAGIGLSFLFDLCGQTNEDRRQEEECTRLMEQLRRDMEEETLPNLRR